MIPIKRFVCTYSRVLLLATVLAVLGFEAAYSESVLVVGFNSDNVVEFDLVTGKSQVIAKLVNKARPRGIAVSPGGDIFIALQGAGQNVVRLQPSRPQRGPVPMIAADVTPQIGRFGPGQIAFDWRGTLVVAGDTERVVKRYDVETSELIESLTFGRKANLVGLAVNGPDVFVAEYFQKSVLRWDLAADPPAGAVFVSRSDSLDRPHGMTVGHNGNVFVSSLRNHRIEEFDRLSGKPLGTFLDVNTIGASNINDIVFSRRSDRYLVASGDEVYEFSTHGELLSVFRSPSILGARAIAVLPPNHPIAVFERNAHETARGE